METVGGFVEAPRKASSQRQRRDVIRNFVLGNGWLTEKEVPDTHTLTEEQKAKVWAGLYQAADEGISKLDKKGLVEGINKTADYMEKKGSSGTTISGHMAKVGKLYWLLDLMTKEELLKAKEKGTIRHVDSVNVTDDRQLTREQIRDMLKLHCTPRQKALVSFMACTGARIGETVQVKIRDIDFTKSPAVVYFPARHTKTKQKRYSFLSSECVEFLRAHIANRDRVRKSEWLFEGFIPNRENRASFKDKHASASAAYLQIRGVLAAAGLVPPITKSPEKETAGANTGAHLEYHPHVLRGTCTTMMKQSGYPPEWAEWLVGHDISTQAHYLPTQEEAAKEWLKKCEPTFCFLGSIDSVEVTKRLDEIEKAVNIFAQEGSPDDKVVMIKNTKTGETEGSLILPNKGNGTDAKRWSNHKFDFVKCEIGSDEFDKALEEGYEVFTQAEKLAYLRKPKT